jgi:signal transduction histidine kinase/integral membrane sensor domain MASE1/ActR/RegA family two-component response regulator
MGKGTSAPGPRNLLMRAAGLLALAAVYFGAAKLGLSLAVGRAEQVSAVWPPTGIALAAVLLFGYRVWPGIALGAFLANALANEPLGTACGIATGNTLEALVGAWLLRHLVGFDNALDRLRDVLGLIVLAAGLSTTVSASIGVASLCLGGVQPWEAYGDLWSVWWLGDAMGALVMAPVLLTWPARRGPWSARRLVEAVALFGGLIATSALVFGGRASTGLGESTLAYSIFPFIIWAALRFGQRETTAVTLIASGLAVWGTVRGLGPFGGGSAHERLLLLQIFMAIIAVTALLLAAALTERRREAQRTAALYAVTRILAESATLTEAAPKIIQAICHSLAWRLGGIWQVDPESQVLRCVEIQHEGPARFLQFEALMRQRTFDAGIGLPGRVWASGQPAWIPDVVRDNNFPRAPVAAKEGLHGAFGFPIRLGGQILGVIEFFSPEIRRPDDDLLGMMATVGSQIGQFIERKRGEEARRRSEVVSRFLADASAALAAVTDYESTLQKVARLAVPFYADWCAVDMLEEDGSLRRLAVAHVDPTKVQLAQELQRRYPPDPAAPQGVWNILGTGRPEIIADISDDFLIARVKDPELLRILRELGLKSYIGVPLTARGKVLGVITFIAAESGRRYEPSDLAAAEDLAQRAAVAIENARLYQALLEADRRKDDFLAVLAHELRNPLAPLRNALHLLKTRQADAAIGEQARQIMERQVEQLVRLVDDLLDISRIMRGKIELRRAPIELATVVARAVETSQPAIDAGGHELTIALPSEPLWLNGDLVRLAQVVSNLLNNAAKYTENGGKIWLIGARENDEAVVRVRDTGIGIAAEMRSRIFDLFVQAGRAHDRAQGGMGIGLTLVRSLVEMHGGSVAVHSDGPGQGSEFVVKLPILKTSGDEDHQGKHVEPRPTGRPAPRQILVVDDKVDVADSLALLLRLEGHDVQVAYDAPAALAQAVARPPDIAFLDIGMPKMNGCELAQRFRASPMLKDVVLVALTGWGQEEDRRRTKQAGFDYHLVKPVDPDALHTLLAHPESARPK